MVQLKAAGGGEGMAVTVQICICNGALSTLLREKVKQVKQAKASKQAKHAKQAKQARPVKTVPLQLSVMALCVRLLVAAGVYLGDGCLLTGCRMTFCHNAPLLSHSVGVCVSY